MEKKEFKIKKLTNGMGHSHLVVIRKNEKSKHLENLHQLMKQEKIIF